MLHLGEDHIGYENRQPLNGFVTLSLGGPTSDLAIPGWTCCGSRSILDYDYDYDYDEDDAPATVRERTIWPQAGILMGKNVGSATRETCENARGSAS